MRQTLIALSISAAMVAVTGCSKESEPVAKSPAAEQVSESVAATAPVDNVLLAEWSGPFGGVPAFDAMDIGALKPALEFGMAENLAEIDKIANYPEAPTFVNTIAEMERSGKSLSRVFTYWGIWSGNMSSPEFRAVQAEMAPKLAAFSSKIIQNDKLFQRVKAVYDARNDADLTAEQIRVVELTYDEFATNGATLSGEAKERYAAINNRLAELHTSFANNVLADEEGYDLFLSEDQLAGLPESFVKAAAALATEKGQAGKYAITNTRSSMDPFLTYSTNRELREKVWSNYYSRGDNGDEHDNNAIIAEILQLRDERVALLGFDNYAAWRLQNRMAKTPQRAIALMEAVWPAAVARVHEEVADMQAVANAENAGIEIAPWDYRFYAEKVRKAKYDLNSDEVKQYLQLDNLREGMFYVAGELFNFIFSPVKEGSVPVFHEDVKVWEVTDKTSGEHIGLWYLDPFARSGKRSGAWASMYRDHTTFDGKETVLASNNSNFIKGAPGEPVLVSWDDAETFFHEFGHALHFLASNVSYPTLNGGVRDYTEFQSQLLERWLSTDPIIDNYLVHYKTGESIPADLVAKIKQAATFNQGFATTEYLASALVDIKLHTTDPTGIDPDKFERETLNALGMPSELVMRHRTPHFGHIFSGEGYSAGYYGYMWADVLTSDASEAFAEAEGGFYDKEVAAKLVKYLFAPRNAIDPAEAYRLFRGRDAGIEPLMRDRGFPLPGEKSEETAAAGE
ncbi:peptidase M3 [Microbulbifer agarilyticus]|uniref:oligopeptidase A n=1 Tax=Microbulbifer agarilyticus TaxID=260552 RepID=A0A1Q2M5C9_9GAMM|nr:M3 family metallopeptidase [Microbulbifer agarilyticus]AQQ67840.1 peptidase M3 [Microbulbifer agarilyticus]